MYKVLKNLVLAVALLVFPQVSWGDQLATVSVDVSQQGARWSYRYTLQVASESTSQVAALLFNLQQGVVVENPTGPANIAFASYKPSNLTGWETPFPQYMVQPGTSAVFEFESTFSPGNVNYSIGGYDTSTGFPTSYRGVISGPVVPEPTAIATVAAVATVALRRRR